MGYHFSVPNQSPWLAEVYDRYIPHKTDGFLVELGVGHTIRSVQMHERKLEDVEDLSRCGSNTADLLDMGWSGIYVDPVMEYCEEARLAHKANMGRLQIVCIGASDEIENLQMYAGDSFREDSHGDIEPHVGRIVETDITSSILKKAMCPSRFDLMSVDVEGFEDRVLKGLDFDRHQPRLLVVETNVVRPSIVDSILPVDYKIVEGDDLNTVWVNEKIQLS